MKISFAMTGAMTVPGGVASANLNILQALVDFLADRRGSLVVLSLLEQDHDRPDFLPDRVVFRGCSGNKVAFSHRLWRCALGRSLCCFDHVSLALPVLPLAASGLLKTVIFAHGSEAWKRIRLTSRWSFRSAALCLTNSEYTLRRMNQVLTGFRGVACPLGLSPLFSGNGLPLAGPPKPIEMTASDGSIHPLGEQVLLLAGRLHPDEREKGHQALIEILPALKAEFPSSQLVFPGPGEDRHRLASLARKLGVASSVFFPGWLPVDELKALYRHCYAFVMPSLQEGFGLAYLEAMSCAKPCLGCFDQGAEDVIVHGETGLLVRDPWNQQELTEAVSFLLREPRTARQMGEEGLKRLRCRFTARHYQERIRKSLALVT